MYTSYALLKDAFGEWVRMLYTDTDSLFLHFFVKDLAMEINARSQLWNVFDFSEIVQGTYPIADILEPDYMPERSAI